MEKNRLEKGSLWFLGSSALLMSSQGIAGIISNNIDQNLDTENNHLNGYRTSLSHAFDIDGDSTQDITVYENRGDYDQVYNGYSNTTPRYCYIGQSCNPSSSYYTRDAYERTAYTESYDWERINLYSSNYSLWSFALMPISDGSRIDSSIVNWVSGATLINDYYRKGYSYNYRYGDAYRGTCGSGKGAYSCNKVNWESWQTHLNNGHSYDTGSWKDELNSSIQDFYVGLRRNNNDGSQNFGWLSLSLNEDGYGSINSSAFNTNKNQYLNAGQTTLNVDQKIQEDSKTIPEPVSIGLFGIGIAGLVARRKLVREQ